MTSTAAASISALQLALEEKDEEAKTWKLRCLQAEAEVRALKRIAKQSGGLSLSTTSSGELRDSDAQAGEEVERLKEQLRQAEQDLSSYKVQSERVEELQEQLQQGSSEVASLQQELQQERMRAVKQQRKTELAQQQCKEELTMMTERAQSEVEKKKKARTELAAAREDAAKIEKDLEDAKVALSREASMSPVRHRGGDLISPPRDFLEVSEALASPAVQEQLVRRQESSGSIRSRMTSPSRKDTLIMPSVPAEAAGAQQSQQQLEQQQLGSTQQLATAQCLSAIQLLHAELQAELLQERAPLGIVGGSQGSSNGSSVGPAGVLRTPVPSRLRQRQQLTTPQRSSPAVPPTKVTAVMQRIQQQLERAQELVAGGGGLPSRPEGVEAPRMPAELAASTASLRASQADTPTSPTDAFGDHDALRREINELRLAKELERGALLSEHGQELDDYIRQNDAERNRLYSEVSELKAACAEAKAHAAATQPIMDIRVHLEGQVSAMGKLITSQLHDIEERHGTRRRQDAAEQDELRMSLQSCQAELATAQEDFNTLAIEFERERREPLPGHAFQSDPPACRSSFKSDGGDAAATIRVPPPNLHVRARREHVSVRPASPLRPDGDSTIQIPMQTRLSEPTGVADMTRSELQALSSPSSPGALRQRVRSQTFGAAVPSDRPRVEATPDKADTWHHDAVTQRKSWHAVGTT